MHASSELYRCLHHQSLCTPSALHTLYLFPRASTAPLPEPAFLSVSQGSLFLTEPCYVVQASLVLGLLVCNTMPSPNLFPFIFIPVPACTHTLCVYVCVGACACTCAYVCVRESKRKRKMCVLLRIPLSSSSEPPSLMWADGQFRVGSGPLTTP